MTLYDPVNIKDNNFKKLIILGNFKSLNNPILLDMGITKIEDEITSIYNKDGSPLIRILCPQIKDEERKSIARDNKSNWTYQLMEQMGQTEHQFFNENLYDELNNVDDTLKNAPYSTRYTIWNGSRYFYLKLLRGKNIWFVDYSNTLNNDDVVLIMNSRATKENVRYNPELKKQLKLQLASNRLWFSDIYARDSIIQEIIK